MLSTPPQRLEVVLPAVLKVSNGPCDNSGKLRVHRNVGVIVYDVPDNFQLGVQVVLPYFSDTEILTSGGLPCQALRDLEQKVG